MITEQNQNNIVRIEFTDEEIMHLMFMVVSSENPDVTDVASLITCLFETICEQFFLTLQEPNVQ